MFRNVAAFWSRSNSVKSWLNIYRNNGNEFEFENLTIGSFCHSRNYAYDEKLFCKSCSIVLPINQKILKQTDKV